MLKFLKKKGKKMSVTYAVISFVLLLIVTQLLVYQRHRAISRNEYNELVLELDDTRDKLNIALNHNISSAKTLAIMYKQDPSLTWFDDVARDLVETNDAIDIVEVVDKDFAITHIYPKEGNEHMIGFNVMSEPRRRAETQLALRNDTIKFSGPYELLQGGGGLGIAGRLPVYQGKKFLGGVVVLTRLSTIRSRMPELENRGKVFTYQLSKVNPATKKTENFFDGYHPQKDWQVSKYMRRGNWDLHVAYVKGYISHWTIYLLSAFGVLCSIMGAAFVYSKTYRAHSLELAVKAKTRELDERVRELSTIYQVNEVLKDERQSIEIALSRVVKIIPGGFRYSNVCQARIVIGDDEYSTGSNKGALYEMQAPIRLDDDCQGFVEVTYVKEEPLETEGPFLKEERNLINALAETIEVYYNKKLNREKITRTEVSLRTTMEAMPVGVLLADEDTTILAINSKMKNLHTTLPIVPLEVGRTFMSAVRPDRHEQVKENFRRVIQDKEPLEYDVRYGTEDEPIYLSVSMTPVIVNAEAVGVCITNVDITDRKKVEIEYKRIISDLMQHMTTMVEFARTMNERVGEPVAAIISTAEQAEKDLSDKAHTDALSDIHKLAKDIDHMLKEMDETLNVKEN